MLPRESNAPTRGTMTMMARPMIMVPSLPAARNIAPRDSITVATPITAPNGRIKGSKPFISMSPYELKSDISDTSDDYTVGESLGQFTLFCQPIPHGIGKPCKLNGAGSLEAALHAQKSGSDGFDGGFSSIAGIQFCDDALDVLLGCYFGDEKLSCDGFIGKPLNQQPQHIHLSWG